MYYENRSKAVKALLESSSPNPYPHKFHVTYDDKQFVKDYEHIKVRTCARRGASEAERQAGRWMLISPGT